jgi:hypothetical protein
MGNTSNCRKTQSRIGKHGSLRMPIRSLVNSSVTVEKGPTAIGGSATALLPVAWCVSV